MIIKKKTIEGNEIKLVDNDDLNIFLKEWYGIYINDTLNLLAPIDIDVVLIAMSLNTIEDFIETVENNTWSRKLNGVI